MDFARAHGKKFAIPEWGVGRRGDKPEFIQKMHEFFTQNADNIAYESYFNCGSYKVYGSSRNSDSGRIYQNMF